MSATPDTRGTRTVDAVLTWLHPVAAAAVVLVAAQVILGGGPAGSRDLQGSQAAAFLGVIQALVLGTGLTLSLLVNFRLLRWHRPHGLSAVERALVIVQFVVIALVLVGLVVEVPETAMTVTRFYGGPVLVGLAIAVAVVAGRRNRALRELRAASATEPPSPTAPSRPD